MKTPPSESTAASIVTRGAIERAGTELVVPGACHFIRRKSLMPNQVWSKLIKTLPGASYKKARAHCCLSTRLRSLLPAKAIC